MEYLKYVGICYAIIGLIYAITLFIVRPKQFYNYWLSGFLKDVLLFLMCISLWPVWLLLSKFKYDIAKHEARIKAAQEPKKEPKIVREGPQPVRTN
jgi:hypothetical protein